MKKHFEIQPPDKNFLGDIIAEEEMKDIQTGKKLSPQMDEFCKTYATDNECRGNARASYVKVYKVSIITAKARVPTLMKNFRIIKRINEYLTIEGFEDTNIDAQHLFLINQHQDFSVKMKGIEHYNKLKQRVSERLEIILPKPIIELEEAEFTEKDV